MEQERSATRRLLVSALQRALAETDITSQNHTSIAEALQCAKACEFDDSSLHARDIALLSQIAVFLGQTRYQIAGMEERRALDVARRALRSAFMTLEAPPQRSSEPYPDRNRHV